MLSPYRVLDLTDERGVLCGQILADLGADVIQVEPPGGSPARRLGPFYQDEPSPEKSLYWWAYCRNKRGITLDLDDSDGQETLRRLVRSAHFFIESETLGVMAARGLGYDDLARINPGLIYVSITAFGQDGPKAGWAGTDLTVLAAGGPLILAGDRDRAPVRASVPQASHHAAGDAAGAALIAHQEWRRSGLGQHVDVSAQQSVAQATMALILSAPVGETESVRASGGMVLGPLEARLIWQATDGYISLTFFFGSAIGPFTRRFMEWVFEEGGCDAATRDKDWIAYAQLLLSGDEPMEEFERVKQVVAEFIATKSKAELFETAQERGLLIVPVTEIDEVATSPQLEARGYWRTLEHPEVGASIRYPGPFVQFSENPIAYRRRAPLIGEHNAEVLGEPAADAPAASPSPSAEPAEPAELPLRDVKVLDFFWVVAGPTATRVLADYGATVIRVESTKRVETARTIQPFHKGQPGPENSSLFGTANAGKLGLTLNLGTEEGRNVVRDLARWADVVTESFSPKAMRAWGLDYEALARINPRIVMLSSCLFGQSGPLAGVAGFGTMGSAISGFINLAGWPDRPPVGPFGAYSDYCAPRFTVPALLVALEYRDRTGKGLYIDQSQAESALHFIGPAFLDYTVNGRVAQRTGNRDPLMAPHGVYPASGEDAWVAIAVRDDDDWRRFCVASGRADLAGDARFATAAGRKANEDALDALVSEWSASRPAADAERALQAQGVPASVVQGSSLCAADPQLGHRGHFVELEHPVHGTTIVEGSRFRLSRTPAAITRAAPTFGRDNDYVLRELLGYDEGRIADLAIAGALE